MGSSCNVIIQLTRSQSLASQFISYKHVSVGIHLYEQSNVRE